jgi:parallel beta-helix repeat protein
LLLQKHFPWLVAFLLPFTISPAGGISVRRSHLALSLLLLVLVARPLVAGTYYVGTCKSGAFPTISAAVSAVPAGSTVDVCPAVYQEQVVISKPLKLVGISTDDVSLAVITMPYAGLATTSSLAFGSIAAQVQVTAGPVDISGITVDGYVTSGVCPNVAFAGIFYSSGSSGTLNEVQTLLQNCNTSGIGVVAENGAGPSQSVTIENSCLQTSSDAGVLAYTDQTPPTLTATIKGNYVASTYVGIFVQNTDGSVSGNNVNATGGGFGIDTWSASSPIKGNTISGASYYGIAVDAGSDISGNTVNMPLSSLSNSPIGIDVNAPGSSITSNLIFAAPGPPSYGPQEIGIDLNTGDATVMNNTIMGTDVASFYNDLYAGIALNCNAATVSGNFINGAYTGLLQVPAGFTGVNKFYNTEYALGGC